MKSAAVVFGGNEILQSLPWLRTEHQWLTGIIAYVSVLQGKEDHTY